MSAASRAPSADDLSDHRLSLVPTPIGNLGDITLRALETLRGADVVAAEDTRRSRVLLERHGVATKLTRLDAHTIATRAPRVLREHRHVAFVTDAGTPGISDPGAELVAIARDLGIAVEVLPGATAFVPALVLSGLPAARFTFEGFLPRRGRERRERIARIAARDHPSIVYEAPTRLAASLRELARACGDGRSAAVVRELTKLHEETVRDSLGALRQRFEETPPRGEVVLVVGAASVEEAAAASEGAPDDAGVLAASLARDGLWGRELRAALVEAGVPRDLAYRLAMRHK
ncbi:MAG: 16S rRNA (cytidine(1402)-2'-O)-methyltransferase, partial [Nocardiopsis sp. BM-2018]